MSAGLARAQILRVRADAYRAMHARLVHVLLRYGRRDTVQFAVWLLSGAGATGGAGGACVVCFALVVVR